MSIELPADLETRVARYADEAGLAPEDVVRRFVLDGLGLVESVQRTPAQRLIGLFSSPEDVALMEEVDAIIEEGRRHERSLEPISFDVDA